MCIEGALSLPRDLMARPFTRFTTLVFKMTITLMPTAFGPIVDRSEDAATNAIKKLLHRKIKTYRVVL